MVANEANGRAWPECVIRQTDADTGAQERRAVGAAAMMRDVPVVPASTDALDALQARLVTGMALPVGTVEFVRRAIQLAGMDEPPEASYPKVLAWALRRRIERRRKDEVPMGWFVKPASTKLFTGFVLPAQSTPDGLDEHDREQWEVFQSLPGEVAVLVSEPVRWQCEWRYYISHGLVAGSARYDPDGADAAPAPEASVLERAVQCLRDEFGGDVTCAVDLGVLSDGQTALIEVNDAWGGLGLYSGSLSHVAYLEMIWRRWQQIASKRQ